MKKCLLYIFCSLFVFYAHKLSSQAVANFMAPDTVCVNQTFTITNQCVGANKYYWSFCQGNPLSPPMAINLGNIGFFSGPVFITMAKDGPNYYGFVTNNFNSNITRLFYGSSLLNNPVATNLGNVSGQLPGNLEDLHLEFQGGNWYGIVTGGIPGAIARLNFGSSLGNTPTAVNLGNIGGLNYPQRIKIFNSGGNYYGFIPNRNNNTITRLSFGASIANTPTGLNLGNIGGLNIPDALAIINVGGLWHSYVINEGNNTITRLDFGASLLNMPTGTNLGNTGALNGPRAIDVWTECNQIRGLITNRYGNDLLNMSFPAGPTGPVITTSYGNIASFAFPHSIGRFRSGDTLYAFITNVNNNTMSRIYFPGCTNASIPSSTLTTPPPISYNAPGNYYINVLINEGQITQTNYCKQVTVVNSPTIIASNSGPVCSGNSMTLTASGALSYTWNPGGLTGGTVTVNPSANTIYTVTGSNGGSGSSIVCTNSAVTSVIVVPGPTLNISVTSPTICNGNSTDIIAGGATNYTWSPGGALTPSISVSPTITTTYTVTGGNGQCKNTATLTVVVNPTLNLSLNSSTPSVCSGQSATLTASGATSYTWNPGNMNGSSAIVNPIANTSYSVIGMSGLCSGTAAISLTVNPLPLIGITASPTVFCSGNSSTLIANGGTSYTWNPGALNGTSVTVSPSISTTYTVTSSNGLCSTSTLVPIAVNPLPVVSVNSNGMSCINENLQLFANGSSTFLYQWTGPNNFSSNAQNPSFPLTSSSNSGYYSVSVTDPSSGCTVSSGTNIAVASYSNATIYASTAEGCAPLCVTFTVVSNSQGSVSWSFENNASGTVSPLHCFNEAGDYTISAFISNPNGCGAKGIFYVHAYPQPVADFVFSPSNPVIVDHQVEFTDLSYGTVNSWNWYFMNTPQYQSNLQNPVFVYPDPGTYPVALVIKDNRGCMDTVVKIVEVSEDYAIYIPNAFTPNKDDRNDVFQPKGTGITKYNMQIFDRWGEMIFETNEFEKGWDGQYKNKVCPSDVYSYRIRVESVFNKSHEITGHVTLIR